MFTKFLFFLFNFYLNKKYFETKLKSEILELPSQIDQSEMEQLGLDFGSVLIEMLICVVYKIPSLIQKEFVFKSNKLAKSFF